jgi:two-component system, LytTR family, response regulator
MSNTYKCLIAEDNLLDRDAIEMFLSKIDKLELVAVCSDGLEAIQVLQQKKIDIVFTDIDMPGLSGIELIQQMPHPPVFIFISSFSEYAAESYNLDVIDFVVKPASLSRLEKATHKAIEYIELKKRVENAGTEISGGVFGTNVLAVDTSDHFFIKENFDYTRIDIASLLFIESMGNFSKLQTQQQKKHITLVSLKNMESQLPSHIFKRVHKQYIINMQHIVSISSEGVVMLSGGYQVPLGDIYKASLLEMINKKVLVR